MFPFITNYFMKLHITCQRAWIEPMPKNAFESATIYSRSVYTVRTLLFVDYNLVFLHIYLFTYLIVSLAVQQLWPSRVNGSHLFVRAAFLVSISCYTNIMLTDCRHIIHNDTDNDPYSNRIVYIVIYSNLFEWILSLLLLHYTKTNWQNS